MSDSRIVRIPEGHESRFHLLATLNEEAFRQLVRALSKATPKLTYDELAREVTSSVDLSDNKSIRELVSTVVSLSMVQDRTETAVAEIAEDVIKATRIVDNSKLSLTPFEEEQLKERIAELLGVPSLVIGIKAGDLLAESERTFQSSRILTDIRPVFDTGDYDQVRDMKAAVLVHDLRISYYDRKSELTDVHISLNSDDLELLIDDLRRAQEKAQILENFLLKAKVQFID